MIYQWYHWQQKNVPGFLVTIGKNGTNSTIGRFADFTIGRTPNVAIFCDIEDQSKQNQMEKNEQKRSVSGRYAQNKFRAILTKKMASVTASCVQKLFIGPGRFL